MKASQDFFEFGSGDEGEALEAEGLEGGLEDGLEEGGFAKVVKAIVQIPRS